MHARAPKTAAELMERHRRAFHDTCYWSTCPLYQLVRSGITEVFGSAVLFKVGERHFVVSARHVFRSIQQRPLTLLGKGPTVLSNDQPFFFTREIDGNDTFDVAVLQLTSSQVADIGDCRYLGMQDVDLFEEPDFRRPKGSKYFVSGFPCNAQGRPREGQVTIPKSMTIGALPLTREHYEALGFNPSTHLLLSFNRKLATRGEGIFTAPKLHGMSGGSAWTAPRGLESEPNKFLGILIEHHDKTAGAIVATRPHAIFAKIAWEFPDTSDEICAAFQSRSNATRRQDTHIFPGRR